MNPVKARHHPSLLYRIAVLSLPLSLLYGAFLTLYRLLRTPLNGDLNSSFLIMVLQVLIIAPLAVLIGFLIMRRSPGNIIGPLIVHYGVGGSTGGAIAVADQFVAPLIQFYSQAVFLTVMVLILFYFPTGDTILRGVARVINMLLIIAPIYSVVSILSLPVISPGFPANPFYIPALAPLTAVVTGTYGIILTPLFLLAIAAVVLRYRSAEGRERAQMRWLVSAAGSFVVLMVGWTIIPTVPGGMESAFGWLVQLVSATWFFAAIPLAVGFAILRHNLYDIDIIIRRTLIYGVLTALLAVLYWAGVVGLQALLRPFTGAGNDLAVVATTLIIAALFLPLRRRIQAFIDRRFFRRKYDAAKTIAAFSDHVRDEVELDRLTGWLVEVVDETMRPAHVSLWLREATPNSPRVTNQGGQA
jgi:hypothetical protein